MGANAFLRERERQTERRERERERERRETGLFSSCLALPCNLGKGMAIYGGEISIDLKNKEIFDLVKLLRYLPG